MPTKYTPRRCGSRWLDGDCPAGVLAIIDLGPKETSPERYDVLYTEVISGDQLGNAWLGGVSITEGGSMYHFEMEAYKMADYRYRIKHRYTKWSTLPDAVKAAVRRDLEASE